MKYSIIVPIYKEKNNISLLITEITSILKNNKIIFEIILIDDQSNDGSIEEYKKSKNKYTKFFIRNVKPKDLSKSVIFGIKKSSYQNIIVMDGDLQHSPKELLKLINFVIFCSFAAKSKFLPISTFSHKNETGFLIFACIPPTLAAAWMIISGLFLDK